MALETTDIIPVQKNTGGVGSVRKATIGALLALAQTTSSFWKRDGGTLSPVTDGDNIETDGSVSGDALIASTSITSGGSILASDTIQAINTVHIGADAQPVQITLDGTTGEIGGGASVFIDGGTY